MNTSHGLPQAAFIPAAGLGTRLLPLTRHRPKALIEIAGRTLLDRALDLVHAAGIRRAVVNAHHCREQIRRHLATRADLDIRISEEPELLDTGGGARAALSLLGSGPFLVLNCDAVWPDTAPLAALMSAWSGTSAEALLLLANRRQALVCAGDGDFLLAEDGTLRRGPGLIYTGAQIVDDAALRHMPAGKWSFNRFWDRGIARGRVSGVELGSGWWVDAGTPEGLVEAEKYLASVRPSPAKPR